MDSSRRVVISVLVALFLCCGLSPQAGARVMILDNPIRQPFSGFASSVAVVGDLDGDGVSDYVIGAYDQTVNKNPHQGRVFVFSGQSGKLLMTIENPTPSTEKEAYKGAAFGFAVAAAGDVNADGTPDLLIGAFGQDDSGKAFLLSGKDGTLLHTFQAPQPQFGAGFGFATASLGDLTGDGVPDLIISAFAQDGDGKAYVFDGHNRKLLHTLAPPQTSGNSAFGWSVAAVSDLNHDGLSEIVVGAPYTTVDKVAVQGRAYVFNGKDGALLYTLNDPQPRAGEVFGWRVAAGGDLNKDGVPDLLIGAPYKDIGTNLAQGAAFVFNGADGKLLFPLNNPVPRPYSGFGYMLIEGADVNGDSVPEILVGAPFQTVDQFHVQGEVFLFNGQDGRHLTTFDDPYPHQGATFGYSIASPGDINGDKIPEFVVGASGQIIMDKVAVGRVFVFLSQP
ncbi:MAG TPA: FG-GAP-like repeat-containing protein [Candidatus Binatia bacterium]|nr:FG-GAP-like repeat-containing protein [Candidatus Binatia bacterium]